MKSNEQDIFMVVQIGILHYAINIKSIKSIVDENRIIQASSVIDGVYGIVNVGNILIPVFDAKLKAGFGATTNSEHNRVLLLHTCIKNHDLIYGVLVNDIYKILNSNDLKKNNELSVTDPDRFKKVENFNNIHTLLDVNDIKIIQELFNINESITD